jgi:hypothetical protein
MATGVKYYGKPDYDTSVASGFVLISNSVGLRVLKESDIKSQVVVADEASAKALGAVE